MLIKQYLQQLLQQKNLNIIVLWPHRNSMFLWNERVTCCIAHSTPKNSPYGDFCHFCTRKSFVAKITKNCHFGNKKRSFLAILAEELLGGLWPVIQTFQRSTHSHNNIKNQPERRRIKKVAVKNASQSHPWTAHL